MKTRVVILLALSLIAARRPELLGVHGLAGPTGGIPEGLKNNLGVVAVSVFGAWNDIEPCKPGNTACRAGYPLLEGQYDWHTLDSKISAAKTGFKHMKVAVLSSSATTPTWLIDDIQLTTPSEVLNLLDPGHIGLGTSYCKPTRTVAYWNTVYQAKRIALIAAAGARYKDYPEIDSTLTPFANHRTGDWNIEDTVATLGENPLAPCPISNCTPPPGSYVPGSIVMHDGGCSIGVNQPLQWTTAGWTRAKMRDVGEEIIQASADAWTNQSLQLPIGGLDDVLAGAGGELDPRGGDANYTTLAYEVVTWARDPARSFNGFFYPTRNTATTQFSPPLTEPSFGGEQYIKWMIWTAAPLAGLQTVTSASICVGVDGLPCSDATPCRLDTNDPCPIPGIPGQQDIINRALEAMETFDVTFIEMWPDDAKNPNFYTQVSDATLAMGGDLRGPGDFMPDKILLFVQ